MTPVWHYNEPPPNEEIVEVEDWANNGIIIEVMAFYGRDGYKPHWRTKDGDKCWSVDAFKRWRRPHTYFDLD